MIKRLRKQKVKEIKNVNAVEKINARADDSNNHRNNKTSIQWTPGSPIYLSSKKIIFVQK